MPSLFVVSPDTQMRHTRPTFIRVSGEAAVVVRKSEPNRLASRSLKSRSRWLCVVAKSEMECPT